MKLNIFDKLKNDVGNAIDKALGLKTPKIIVYDSINNKEIELKPKVLNIQASGPIEVSKVPVQFKKDGINAISDNIVIKGNTYEITLYETEGFGVLEAAGSFLTGGMKFGKDIIDAGMGKSAIRNLIAVLDRAKNNGFLLKYEDGFDTIEDIVILNNPRTREPKDNDSQVEIKLSVVQVSPFSFESQETKTTSVKSIKDIGAFAGLTGVVNDLKNKAGSTFGMQKKL